MKAFVQIHPLNVTFHGLAIDGHGPAYIDPERIEHFREDNADTFTPAYEYRNVWIIRMMSGDMFAISPEEMSELRSDIFAMNALTRKGQTT